MAGLHRELQAGSLRTVNAGRRRHGRSPTHCCRSQQQPERPIWDAERTFAALSVTDSEVVKKSIFGQ
jgi:hypothetical protein